MEPIAELIGAVVEVLALLGFKYKRVVVEFPLVVAEFALLLLAALLQSWTVLRSVEDLVEAAVGIAPAITMNKCVV